MRLLVKTTVLITAGYVVYRLCRRKGRFIPKFYYPLRRDLNFAWITAEAEKGNVPPIFWSDQFVKYNIGRILVLADYDLIEKCFKNPHLSMRPTNGRSALALELERQDKKIPELVESMFPFDFKPGTHLGIQSGPYDANHKLLRKAWHRTMMKMASRDELEEMISYSGEQIVNQLRKSFDPNGIDPGPVFMNGSLNVITAFLCSETHEFNSLEQVEINNITSGFLDRLMEYGLITAWSSLFPEWMIRKRWHKKLLTIFKPDAFDVIEELLDKQWPLWLQKIKEHEESMDPEHPRDYLDFMLVEAKVANNGIGYLSTVMTVASLFTAGADTLKNTLRWFVSFMAENQDVQEEFYSAAKSCQDENKKPSECEFILAVLEETFRLRPVAESLFHVAECDVEVDGYLIPKGTTIQANLTALHFNQIAFNEPSKFNPKRFLYDGKFKESGFIVKQFLINKQNSKHFERNILLSNHFQLDFEIVPAKGLLV